MRIVKIYEAICIIYINVHFFKKDFVLANLPRPNSNHMNNYKIWMTPMSVLAKFSSSWRYTEGVCMDLCNCVVCQMHKSHLQSLAGVLRKGGIGLEQGLFGAWWKNKWGVILQFAFFLNYTIVHGTVLAQKEKKCCPH